MHIIALLALVAAQSPAGHPISLAAPGLSAINVSEDVRVFYSEQLAQEISLRGIKVTTPKDMESVLGLERQKMLTGCSDQSSSCMTELANALGVDGIVQGSIGKLGKVYQFNVKVIAATNGSQLAVYSGRAETEDGVLDVIQKAARQIVPELQSKLRGGTSNAASDADATVSTDHSDEGEPSASGFILGAEGGVEVLGKTVSPELLAGYHFGGVELSARVRAGTAVGVGVHAGYDLNLGAVSPFFGLRGDYYTGASMIGAGVFAGLRVPLVAGLGILGEGSGELFFGDGPYRNNGVVLALGLDWRP